MPARGSSRVDDHQPSQRPAARQRDERVLVARLRLLAHARQPLVHLGCGLISVLLFATASRARG
jgi:hypothetical protein